MEQINLESLPIKATLLGQTKRDDWDCFEWRIELSSKAGFWTFPYYCGLAHVEKKPGAWPMPNPPYRKGTVAYEQWAERSQRPKRPSNADILHSLLMDSEAESMNFSEWCENFGMSDDSIKALNMYKQCLETATHLRKHLGRDVVAQLKIQLEDH